VEYLYTSYDKKEYIKLIMLKRRGICLVEILVVLILVTSGIFFMIKTCNCLESKIKARTIVTNLITLKNAVLAQDVQPDQKQLLLSIYKNHSFTNNDNVKYFVCFEKEESNIGIYVGCYLEELSDNTELQRCLEDMAEEHGLLNAKGKPYKQDADGSTQVRIFVKAL